MSKKLLKIFLVIIITGFVGFVILSYFFANAFISSNPTIVQNTSNINFENINFKTSDGLNIRGWYYKNSDTSKTIVLLHGYKANRMEMLPKAKMFIDAGYNVLLYDARACAESDGEMVSLGYYEKNDLISAVKFLRDRKTSYIAVYGYSQGGVTAILSGDSLKGVKCIISEVAFDKLENAIDNRFRKYFLYPGAWGLYL